MADWQTGPKRGEVENVLIYSDNVQFWKAEARSTSEWEKAGWVTTIPGCHSDGRCGSIKPSRGSPSSFHKSSQLPTHKSIPELVSGEAKPESQTLKYWYYPFLPISTSVTATLLFSFRPALLRYNGQIKVVHI